MSCFSWSDRLTSFLSEEISVKCQVRITIVSLSVLSSKNGILRKKKQLEELTIQSNTPELFLQTTHRTSVYRCISMHASYSVIWNIKAMYSQRLGFNKIISFYCFIKDILYFSEQFCFAFKRRVPGGAAWCLPESHPALLPHHPHKLQPRGKRQVVSQYYYESNFDLADPLKGFQGLAGVPE